MHDVLAFCHEFRNSNDSCIGMGNSDNHPLWLNGMKNRQSGTNLPERYVREIFYLCYDGTDLVGVFNLKFGLTEYLLNYGGHIGYAVRPSKRNRGYAKEILRLGLLIAEE